MKPDFHGQSCILVDFNLLMVLKQHLSVQSFVICFWEFCDDRDWLIVVLLNDAGVVVEVAMFNWFDDDAEWEQWFA